MKRIGLTLLTVIVISTSVFSQIQFGIGFTGGLPTGQFSDLNTFGAGGYIQGKFAVNNTFHIGLEASAVRFSAVDPDQGGTLPTTDPTTMLPILLTGDYNFSETKWTPYAGFGLGSYMIDSGVVDESRIGFQPRVGLLLGSLNLGLCYNHVKDFAYFSVQLGYLSR